MVSKSVVGGCVGIGRVSPFVYARGEGSFGCLSLRRLSSRFCARPFRILGSGWVRHFWSCSGVGGRSREVRSFFLSPTWVLLVGEDGPPLVPG